MGKIDKLGTAIRFYNQNVKYFVSAAMMESPWAEYWLTRIDAIEEMMRELYSIDIDFTFVNRRKPYPDGKRDFIYKMMVEAE